ncbi:MAG: glucuronate isomerase [Clostridia bacterium]|nr:glucuronate isomerase [Clostridia bacterium]
MAECRGNITPILTSDKARRLYDSVKDLPIVDYHCHLSPKEIYEDKPFSNIGEMWLAGDHYKWRLMRQAGVDERYITGDACYKDKFVKFVDAVSTAFGNPIYDWARLELERFFNVDLPLIPENADIIWDRCNAYIKDNRLSPRSVIASAGVEYIATTDDPADTLEYHSLLAQEGYGVKVCPSFRTDNIVAVDSPDYMTYLGKLGAAAGINIRSLKDLEKAIDARLDYFVSFGCKFSDVGVEGFPSVIYGADDAARAFERLVKGERLDSLNSNGLRGYLYVMLAKAYARRGIVMQLHIAVTRNSNATMFKVCGRDSGFDCVGDTIDVSSIRALFNAADADGGLPRTIIYSLNPTMYYTLATLCGAFRGVSMGISWWFNDHKRGMFDTLDCIAELGHILSLVGMLTDSRSFLSYTRHDYYRRIVCEFLSGVTPDGVDKYALKASYALCYGNAKAIVEG